MNSAKARITLASASPRRKALLEQMGLEVVVAATNAPEETITADDDSTQSATGKDRERGENPFRRLALARALLKAEHALHQPGTFGTLTADTVVETDRRSLEKPIDAADAARMIQALQGRTHMVHTAIAFVPTEAAVADAETAIASSAVSFLSLSEEEIETYVRSEEWVGVAGGYRIQGLAGAFVEHIDGSYTGIMGLPTAAVYSIIRRFLRSIRST